MRPSRGGGGVVNVYTVRFSQQNDTSNDMKYMTYDNPRCS